MEGSATEIGRLPEECVSHVLSLTSPRDSCRSAVVSTAFHRAADSDAVWRRFLPSDHRGITSRAADAPEFESLKELYFLLCRSILIDGGTKIFALDRESGAKCYTLCARELKIIWGDDQRYWNWVSDPDSRFVEVAVLRRVCWLEICGRIACRELSANMIYKAYLIFKFDPQSYGLKAHTQKVSVTLGSQVSQGNVCLQPKEEEEDVESDDEWAMEERDDIPPEAQLPHTRSDGWMEIEMGEFCNDDWGDEEVIMSLREVKTGNWKRGLIIEGIQVRPS